MNLEHLEALELLALLDGGAQVAFEKQNLKAVYHVLVSRAESP